MHTRPTLFHVLLRERRWDRWVVFLPRFERAARELADQTKSPRLASISVSRATYDRWAKGDWYGNPWPDTALVLEHLFSVPCVDLFRPAPDFVRASPAGSDGADLLGSRVITERWPTSRLFLSASGDVSDAWELCGRQALDGTTAAVRFSPATLRGTTAHIEVANADALEQFLRPARRGFLVGVLDQTEPQLFIVDAGNARRMRGSHERGSLQLPAAHLLDELTYGLVWSLVQYDDGLLADDWALDQEQPTLSTYLSLLRSAPSRMTLPDLTNIGANFLGSAFCAQHILRSLDGLSEPPTFWTREQTGEQAAAWLWFRHKSDYLAALSVLYAGAADPLSRAFCVPEAEVSRSDRYERILLLLAITLMERHGIRVDVLADPEFSEIDGFALVQGKMAAVANWVRTEAIWAVDTVTRRSVLRGYHDALGEAETRSVMQGEDPESRLRSLASYLEIPWSWLVTRCREVSECGTESIVRPRSRHLSVDALDDALQFLGALAPGR